jgi:hypothetical protein
LVLEFRQVLPGQILNLKLPQGTDMSIETNRNNVKSQFKIDCKFKFPDYAMGIGILYQTMKLSLFSAAIFCFLLSALPAWAESAQPGLPVPVDPAALSTEGSAADLTVQEQSPGILAGDRTTTLNTAANQINQNLAPSEQEVKPDSPSPLEGLRLPRGMVIRSTQGGALAIGSELQQ